MTEKTFWNYEPTPCRIVRVVVGKSPRPTWWCANLAGTEREAVEVNYHGNPFYLDNDVGPTWSAGSGWRKVTVGRGGPDFGHAELPIERVLNSQ